MLPLRGANFFNPIFPKASPLHGFAVGILYVGPSARINMHYKSPAEFSNRKFSRKFCSRYSFGLKAQHITAQRQSHVMATPWEKW